MFKRFVSSVLVCFILAGCSGGASARSDTAKDAAAKIVEDLALGDHLDEVQPRVIQGLFFFDEGLVSDSALYVANDKTADTVGVFDTEDPDKVLEYVHDYLSSVKEQMQNYYPDEVFKIDNAIVSNDSGRVVLIVTSDIEEAGKEAKTVLQ